MSQIAIKLHHKNPFVINLVRRVSISQFSRSECRVMPTLFHIMFINIRLSIIESNNQEWKAYTRRGVGVVGNRYENFNREIFHYISSATWGESINEMNVERT